MLSEYFPILVFIAIGIFFGTAPIVIGYIISPKRPTRGKLSTYECGFEPERDSRLPFDIRYYLVAILFILFDLEVAFLVPWAVVFRKLGWHGMIAMGIFIGLLVLGFIYEWKKGALDWD
ncbi:MAG: NADH-quinone oxidoreductase subunit A [Pseudomonadota bacterium]